MNTQKKKGFTLIEMLIVLTIVGILVPTTFSIVFVILRQQVRIYRVIETRRQGDYMLNYMKDRLIRTTAMKNNAGSVTRCDETSVGTVYDGGDGTSDQFIANDGTTYSISRNTTENNLYYNSGVSPIALNSTEVEVTAFNISCVRRGLYSSPLVQISFTVKYKDPSPTTQEGTVEIPYQTKIKLRE